jgi:hypothetical protein
MRGRDKSASLPAAGVVDERCCWFLAGILELPFSSSAFSPSLFFFLSVSVFFLFFF